MFYLGLTNVLFLLRYALARQAALRKSIYFGYFALCVGGLVSGHSTSFPYVVR